MTEEMLYVGILDGEIDYALLRILRQAGVSPRLMVFKEAGDELKEGMIALIYQDKGRTDLVRYIMKGVGVEEVVCLTRIPSSGEGAVFLIEYDDETEAVETVTVKTVNRVDAPNAGRHDKEVAEEIIDNPDDFDNDPDAGELEEG